MSWDVGAGSERRGAKLRPSHPETLTKPIQRNWLIGKEGTLRARTVLGPWLEGVCRIQLSRVRNADAVTNVKCHYFQIFHAVVI